MRGVKNFRQAFLARSRLPRACHLSIVLSRAQKPALTRGRDSIQAEGWIPYDPRPGRLLNQIQHPLVISLTCLPPLPRLPEHLLENPLPVDTMVGM